MFQFASTLGIGRKCKYDVKFPMNSKKINKNFADGIKRLAWFELPDIFQINSELLIENVPHTLNRFREPHFHFDKNVFSTMRDNADLFGYFQSEKYFKESEAEVRSNFTFKSNIIKYARKHMPNTSNETVAIHIRGGDFLKLKTFQVCSQKYYNSAISKYFVDKKYHFLIFSDDHKYARKLFNTYDNVTYISTNNAYVEMCMMSLCNHNIIPNSTFGWWSAWLNINKNNKIIMPSKWFNSESKYNFRDVHCKDWIVMDCNGL